MIFSITDIIIALGRSQQTLKTLNKISIKTDDRGRPISWVGNNAVVVRATLEGVEYAMRCYIRPLPHLHKIYGEGHYPEELSIEKRGAADVVLCRWIEGEALSSIVERAIESRDVAKLRSLATAFDKLAIEMLERLDWAHGDLSGDNIIVNSKRDGMSMSLIDLDASYNEAFAGGKSYELGTPAFQSPLRTAAHFNPNIDDFSIALISTALHALECDFWLSKRHPFLDGILLDGQHVAEKEYSPLNEVIEIFASKGLFAPYRVAQLLRYNRIKIDTLPMLLTFGLKNQRSSEEQPKLELFESMGIWGYFNPTDGEVVIPPLFDKAFDFRGDTALVKVMRWWHYIDLSGRAIEHCGEWHKGTPPIKRQ